MSSVLINIAFLSVQVPFSVFIIVINAMVIHVARRVYDLQPSIRYFVCSLALSDLLKGVYTIYDSCYSDWITELTMGHKILCTAGYAFFSTLMLADLITVTLLSIDRLIILERPFSYKLIVTRKSVQISCAVTWVVAICFGFIPFYIRTEMVYMSCDYFAIAPFHSLVLISLFWYPLLVTIIIIYVRIYFLARRHVQKVVPLYLYNTPAARRPTWRQLKSTLMAFVTLIVVLIGVAPTFLIVSYVAVCKMTYCEGFSNDNLDNVNIATAVAATMMVFTGIANPLIYGLRVREVGDHFRSLACCCCKRRKPRPNRVGPDMRSPRAFTLGNIQYRGRTMSQPL